MKRMNQLLFLVTAGFVILICMVNLFLSHNSFRREGRKYRVSINRIEQAVMDYEEERGRAPESLEELKRFSGGNKYPLISSLSSIAIRGASQAELSCFLSESEEDYVVLATEEYYYKVAYRDDSTDKTAIFFIVNGACIIAFGFLLATLLYVRNRILRPFYRLSDIPYELSKGNLTVPLQENKEKFFGRFVWGMDLLREHLEENKARELELLKEKKLLLLSLSHDIKTPLSAIKLYAKALSRNLYRDEEKKREIAENISRKVDEMEGYISEIVHASNEDFMHFDVKNREIYIQDAVKLIREYYADKMELNQTDFTIGACENCLVYGDLDRLVEVMQNVVENAIKYGDGKRIWVEFFRDDEELEICIYNTGCNLEEKEVPHIFDSFFRGSNVGKRPGSGLGLYICRCLMHLMEGEITAWVYRRGEEHIMAVKVAVRLI